MIMKKKKREKKEKLLLPTEKNETSLTNLLAFDYCEFRLKVLADKIKAAYPKVKYKSNNL